MKTKHPLKVLLPDYGDRDFVLGILHEYVMDHCIKHIEDESESNWNIEHAKYANDILKKMGGSGVEIENFAKFKKPAKKLKNYEN